MIEFTTIGPFPLKYRFSNVTGVVSQLKPSYTVDFLAPMHPPLPRGIGRLSIACETLGSSRANEAMN